MSQRNTTNSSNTSSSAAKDKSSGACCLPARAKDVSPPDVPSSPLPRNGRQGANDFTVAIAGGTALIGTANPVHVPDGESPPRKKRVRPFRIDRCTVTNERFLEFASDTGYVTEAERLGDSFVFAGFLPEDLREGPRLAMAPWWRAVEGANWRAIYGPGSEQDWQPDHPVVHVSWNDARAFAEWAGGRLPTEAEWEHAARGGLGDVQFPWGEQEPSDGFLPSNIWQGTFPDVNLALDGYEGTAPAQSFEPNGYGLFNMVGNVWEWTAEPFKLRSLKKSAQAARASQRGYKLVKGGSFLCHASYCYRYRIAARSGTSPDSSMSHQGFRLVYDTDD